MEHSEADFTHGICPECLKKIEIEMKAMADSEEPGTLPAEVKASRLRCLLPLELIGVVD
ncbi:MAG TPA: hypothetical protein VLK23_12240 [Thermodesulfobacteriota bacterium]|nr:hypothetical protein [Thermodesulfobacteriota bacterium]